MSTNPTPSDRVREAREAVIASGKYTVTVGPWNVNIPGPRYGVWSTDENREVFSCAMASQVSAWLMRTEEQHCTDDEMAALLSLSRAECAAEIAALKVDRDHLNEMYVSLLNEVAVKIPNETRYETARRYIREREAQRHEAGDASEPRGRE